MEYIVIGNIGKHNGWIEEVDPATIWSGSNPNGWTYQQLCGSHGTVLGEYQTEAEAQERLNEWLQCPAAERGDYCYTHNA
jgi:hypothetical protein